MALVIEVQYMNKLCVTIDYDVGVVGHDNELTTQFIAADLLYNQSVDQVVIQVIFWLVEHQWLIAMRQQEGQHGRCPLPSGRLTDGLKVPPVPLTAVLHLQTVFGEPTQNVIDKFRALASFRFQEFIEPVTKLRLPATGL